MKHDVPADLATLAWAAPGQQLEVRSVLRGAGRFCDTLRPGDVLRCRRIHREGPVFSSVQCAEIRLSWGHASRVQVERIGFVGTVPFWRDEAARPAITARILNRAEPLLRPARTYRTRR